MHADKIYLYLPFDTTNEMKLVTTYQVTVGFPNFESPFILIRGRIAHNGLNVETKAFYVQLHIS